jgi:tetratricopeptide (TPR) repeat protein
MAASGPAGFSTAASSTAASAMASSDPAAPSRAGSRAGGWARGGRRAESAARVRSGDVPPLADAFSPRTETGVGPGILPPGHSLVLRASATGLGPMIDWPGGTGVTQSAVYIAEMLWRERQIDLLIWVRAATRSGVLAGYARALADVGRGGLGAQGGQGSRAADRGGDAARLLAWLRQTSTSWLVVLDGVASEEALEDLWPEGPGGRVVVTVRGALVQPRLQRARSFTVGPFSPHEALGYVFARLSADPDQRVGAVDLLDVLGTEPLAVAQACSAITNSSLTCRGYRDMFTAKRDEMADRAGCPVASKAVAWALCLDEAALLLPGGQSQACLALAALLEPDAMPAALFSAPAAAEFIGITRAAGTDPARGVLRSLARLGLLTVDDAAGLVGMPTPVRAAVRSVTPTPLRDAAAQAAATALMQTWPELETEPWEGDPFRACVASLEQTAADALWDGQSHDVLFQAAASLDRVGLVGPAVAQWQALAAHSQQRLGASHPDSQLALDRLGQACLAAGQAERAVEVFRRAVDMRASSLGPSHPSTMVAESNLMRALLAAGEVVEAIGSLERARARAVAADPAGDDVLEVSDRLVGAYRAAGRMGDALSLAMANVAARERRHGPDDVATLSSRAELARICLAAGNAEDAIGHGKRALAGRERVLGRDHPDTLDVVVTLASAYLTARRLRDAIPLYERALRDGERVLGPDHRRTMGVRGNLASAYHSAGRMAAAIPLYERTRADCQRVLGPEHIDTLTARTNLAIGYCAVGRLSEAVALLESTLADCERALPPGDPLTEAVRESLQTVGEA